MGDFIDSYLVDLLHLEDVEKNKLIDLETNDSKTIYLSHSEKNNSLSILSIIRNRYGKTGNTKLRKSSLSDVEQIIGDDINVLDWNFSNGQANASSLNSFINEVYKDIKIKGTNTLFLSIGAIKWRVVFGRGEYKDVITPLLIFPIKLIRAGNSSPVSIEFVNDDIFINPCLLKKLEKTYSDSVLRSFPHPNGKVNSLDEAVDLEKLGDGVSYFNAIKEYVEASKNINDENTVFEFLEDLVAISSYDHNEICMYYDIIKNKEKIINHPLVKKVFIKNYSSDKVKKENGSVYMSLTYDSSQEKIIKKVVDGESLIIKGPPGTGKTQTITNIITSLLGNGKKVLLSSRKKSSLTEVYAKLPLEIKMFALLLEAETEDATAKISASNIAHDLGAILKFVEKYPDTNVYRDYQKLILEKSHGVSGLQEYYEKVFKNAPIGISYFDCVNRFFKNSQLPIIPLFDENTSVLKTKMDVYDLITSKLVDFEKYYLTITRNENHSLESSPWYGLKDGAPIEDILLKFRSLVKTFETLSSEIKKVNVSSMIDINKVKLITLEYISNSQITAELIDSVAKTSCDMEKLAKQLLIAENLELKIDNYDNINEYALLSKKFNKISLPLNLRVNKLQLIAENKDLFLAENSFFLDSNTVKTILGLYEQINKHNAISLKYENEYLEIFKSDLTQQDKEFINSSYDVLKKYKNSDKPLGLFDIKAKKLFEKLKKLSYLDNVTFKEIVDSTEVFVQYYNEANEIENLVKSINKIFHKVLTQNELECIFFILENIDEDASIKDLVNEVLKYTDLIYEIKKKLDVDDTIKLSEMKIILDSYTKYKKLIDLDLEVIDNVNNPISTAKAILALNDLNNIKEFKYTNKETILDLFSNVSVYKKSILELIGALKAELVQLDEYFDGNKYVNDFKRINIEDIETFSNDSTDLDIIGANAELNALAGLKLLAKLKKIMSTGDVFTLKNYEYKENESKLVQIFEHTFFDAYIKSYLLSLGKERYSVTKGIEDDLERIELNDNLILSLNKRIVEDKIVKSIDIKEDCYQFLASQRTEKTLRALFKNHSEAILNLKKCLIISPSTASVLFAPEEYESFDVAIIDEASQLEPVNLLPILFRSKQIIIVGDEWQMPPIVHFKKKGQNSAEDIDEIDAVPSVLSVSLANEAFKAYELECHFRSKTESLISFSQKNFYDFMKTFPAPIPRKEGSLGFKDIYIPDAISKSGENEKEAEQVITELKIHFDKYYDKANKKLLRSIGVVAFGVGQINLIDKKIKADASLNEMVRDAINTFVTETGNVEEKIFFLKTIETVQGQEADHLILSLTYGVDRNGDVSNRFGTLNQGDLGKCVFNVSVTRGKYHVTVIHSILARDLSDKLSYIAEYLNMVEGFAKEDKTQFVSIKPEDGLITNVGEYIESLGINKNRIVFNYGVTNGSIRIPIAILSEDLSRAIGGVWVEKFTPANHYIDYNIRYKNILKQGGWKLFSIYCNSWYDNNEKSREALKDYIFTL